MSIVWRSESLVFLNSSRCLLGSIIPSVGLSVVDGASVGNSGLISNEDSIGLIETDGTAEKRDSLNLVKIVSICII